MPPVSAAYIGMGIEQVILSGDKSSYVEHQKLFWITLFHMSVFNRWLNPFRFQMLCHTGYTVVPVCAKIGWEMFTMAPDCFNIGWEMFTKLSLVYAVSQW